MAGPRRRPEQLSRANREDSRERLESRRRPLQAVTTEVVNHDAPAEILGDVLKLENEIIQRGNALLATLAPSDGERAGVRGTSAKSKRA